MLIRQRQAEGIAAAKARGVRFGRKPLDLPPGFEEVCKAYGAGKTTIKAAASSLGMSQTTFYRKLKQHFAEKTK